MFAASMVLTGLCTLAALFNPFVGIFALFQFVMFLCVLVIGINMHAREQALVSSEPVGIHRKMVEELGMSFEDAERTTAHVMSTFSWVLRICAVALVIVSAAMDGILYLLFTDPDLGGPKSASPFAGLDAAPLAPTLFIAGIVFSVAAAVCIFLYAAHVRRVAKQYL